MKTTKIVALGLIILFSVYLNLSNIFISLPRSTMTAAVADFDSSLVYYNSFDSESATGKIGNAKSFNGDSLSIGNPSELQINGDISLCAWINYKDTSRFILAKSDGNTRDYAMYISGAGYLTLYSGVNAYTSNPNTVTSNVWNHVCITVNGTNIKYYINNTEYALGQTTSITNTNKTFAIGGDGSSPGYNFNGLIDDVRIYSKSLSVNEISQLYNYSSAQEIVDSIIPPPPITLPTNTTDWYVRSSCQFNGNGTAQNCASISGGVGAWQGFPNIVWSSIKSGHTLYLTGGDTYTSGLSVGASGTVNNPITITVVGNGSVIINGSNTNIAAINFSGNKYIIVDGKTGNATTGDTNYGIRVINIGDGGYCGYENNGGGNIKILHVECTGSQQTSMYDSQGGFYIQGGSIGDIELGYNWIHGPSSTNKWYASCASVWSNTGTSNFTDNLIHHNQCENMYHDGFKAGSNVSIYNNIIKHIDGSGHSDSLLCQSGSYCQIYNNYIEGSGDQNIYLDNISSATQSHVRVYNNVINSNPGFGIVIDSETAPWNDIVIANNTFYTTSASAIRSSGRGSVTNLVILNNIFGSVTSGSYNTIDLYPSTSFSNVLPAWDYNLYSTASANYPGLASITGGSNPRSLTQLQALSPVREIHGNVGIPTYINNTNRDFHLSPNDIYARGKGVNLSFAYSFLVNDKDGKTKPSSGAWDIGAYQSDTSVGGTVLNSDIKVGDFNNDGLVNSLDLSILTSYWNQSNSTYDLNKDGTINSLDYVIMVQNWTQ